VLLLFAKIKKTGLVSKKLLVSLGKILLASAALGTVSGMIHHFTDGQGMVRSIVSIVLSLIGGAAAYAVVLFVTRSEELTELLSMAKKKGAKE
jgi:peptidoglycan biosynthesis protein MviN/MurJ (putative lipid II flippase)